MKIGYFPFSFAILLIILNAASLSYGYTNTADQLSLLTKTESTRAGTAHKTLKLILLSSFEIIEEDRLKTSGPTNRQASKSKHVLLRDFSMFCQKNSTNWITSEGIQWIEAITYPKILKQVASVIAQTTTPKVNILHEMLMVVLRPLISARLPYIIKPINDRVYGRI